MADLTSWAGAMRAAVPALENHLWQSTVFAGIAAGLALALKKNQARTRYWIWMSASAKLLLPFALLAGVASHFVKPRPVAAPANAQMYVAVEDVSEPFEVQGRADREQETDAVSPASLETHVSEARPFDKLRGAPNFVASLLPLVPLIRGLVWLAGFVVVMVVWSVRWRRVAKTMREAALVCEGREVGALRRIEGVAGLRRPVEMRASASVMEPGVFGIVRPVLSWPAGISGRLDDAQLEAVLAHEVCHVRRRDNLTAALHMFVQAVFWFHPMVWWVGARLVEERERACDEEVLEFCGRPQAYAESILKVCEFCVESPLTCVAGVTGADLKKRVVEIMTTRVVRKLTWGKKLLLVAVALVVAAVPFVLGQAKAARRVMTMALQSAPMSIRVAARAVIAVTETPATGELAASQPVGVPATTTEYRSGLEPAIATLDSTTANYVLVAQQQPGPFTIPPPIHSIRSDHPAPGMIDAQQDNSPAEITLAGHGDTDWLEMAQVTSRTRGQIVSVRVGWAYVLAGGLDYHASDVIKTPNGLPGGSSFQTAALGAAARADAKDFIFFVEQVTLADGTVANADHAGIAAFYTSCCTGPNVGKVPREPLPRVQDNVPGGSVGKGLSATTNLKPISFDVVSFRKAAQQGRGREMPVDGDFIAYHGSTIDALLQFAYLEKKTYFMISNEPDWVKSDFYEFTAKVAPEDVAEWKALTLTDRRIMMRKLLEDVLKVKAHPDTEPHPVYDLVVAKGGPKLTEYRAGDTIQLPGGRTMTGKVLMWFDPFNLTCQDETMADLVNSMSGPNRAGRVVIDKTELKGVYNFVVPIPYQPLPTQIQQIGEDSGVPSVYEGLKSLGLQLVPSKGPIDGIIVDHIERPPEN